MSSKIRRSIDFEPEDLKWITRVVEERKKEDPAYSRNLLIGEAIAALKEKLKGDEMTMEEFAQHLGFATESVLLEDASEIAVVEGDIHWYITRLPDGRWAAWDDSELSPDRVSYFDTREEAVKFHRKGFCYSDLPEEAWKNESIVRYSFTITCDICGQILESDIHPWWDRRPEVGEELSICCDCYLEEEGDRDAEQSVIVTYDVADVFVGEKEIQNHFGHEAHLERPFGKLIEISIVESADVRVRPK